MLTPPPSAVAKGKARAREPSSPLTEAVVEVGEDDEVEEPPLRTTNGWPYRYFGQHTDPDKVFDPHDSIYPRASTRVGTRFQCAIVPEVGDKSPAETGPVASTSKGKAKRESKAKSDSVLIARGTAAGVDRSSEAMWLPPEACDDLLARVRALPAALEAGVIMLDAALESLADHHGDVERAFKAVSELSAANLGVPDWSEAEIARLDWGIKHHQDDLEDIAHALPDKSLRNVIHYFYVHRPEACVGHDLSDRLTSAATSSSTPTNSVSAAAVRLGTSAATTCRSTSTARMSRSRTRRVRSAASPRPGPGIAVRPVSVARAATTRTRSCATRAASDGDIVRDRAGRLC